MASALPPEIPAAPSLDSLQSQTAGARDVVPVVDGCGVSRGWVTPMISWSSLGLIVAIALAIFALLEVVAWFLESPIPEDR